MIDVISEAPKLRTLARAAAKRSKSRPLGGVSPRMRGMPARGFGVVSEAAPSQKAAAFPGFAYHGGPVVQCSQVYTTFWGDQWLSDPAHLTRAGNLSRFMQDLLASNYMNILSQYGVGIGAGLAGVFHRASFVSSVASQLSDIDIHSNIQSCIDAGVLPEPSVATSSARRSTVTLIIYLDDTIAVNDPADGIVMCEATADTAFGYHSFFTTAAGNPFYYAVIPGLTDTCLSESCPGNDGGCSLHLAETQEERQTQVTSHEFAEMTTDPELNAWYDPGAGENGDLCNGQTDTITVGANTWAVQRQYSLTDDIASNGANYCVTEAATALPALSGGPTSGTLRSERIRQLHSVKGLLPLPSVSFDLRTKKASMNGAHVRDYMHRLLRPLNHANLVPDIPGLLRSFADHLEQNP
jgi:hypothetical protein